MLYLPQLHIRGAPKKVSVKVFFQDTISAFTAYRTSDTIMQPRHCDTSVRWLCEFPLRVLFNKLTNELDRSYGTTVEELCWEVWIKREVFPPVWPTEEI
jgi:hypothetical protein